MDPASDRQRHDFKDGICKYGFAISQGAYTEAARKVFEVLDRPEKVLSGREYLIGDNFASAGVFLYKPKIRFIIAYYGLFECDLFTIRYQWPNICNYQLNKAFQ